MRTHEWAPRVLIAGILLIGLPCYLLGAFDFMTYLMPVPFLLAQVAAWRIGRQSRAMQHR